MSKYPENLKYTRDHEWLKIEGNVALIGITDYAAEQLGDIVHAELPSIDQEFDQGTSFGVLESVKSVSDIYIPLKGKVVDVNSLLVENSGLLNEDPYQEGWLVKIEVIDEEGLDQLMSAEGYESFLSEEA
jgi:glycine cleavage system H protein